MQPKSPFIHLLHFFLEGHFLISLGACALCFETNLLLHQSLQSNFFYAFVFFATLFTYNLYYIKDANFLYAKSLAIVGLAGSILSFFLMPYQPIVSLGIITVLSILYILPIFIAIRKPEAFNVQKLILLICIWVITTYVMPQTEFHFDAQQVVLLTYRTLFISLLSLLFFIRDEAKPILKRRGIFTTYLLIAMQYLTCISIALLCDIGLALVFAFITSLLLLLTIRFTRKKVASMYYLGFVDGLMCLELIFVTLKLAYFNES